MKRIHFHHPDQEAFGRVLKERVDNYFSENKISPYANAKMIVKMIIILLAFIVPYFFILFGGLQGMQAWVLCVVMGFAMAGIGFIISHQAAHNAVSRSSRVNRMLSLTFNLTGMSDYMWKIKHNVFHHAYTNVYELDEALKEGDALRLSHDAPHKPMHRYQHFYTFFVYALFTLFWAFVLDFEKYFRYNGNGSRHPKPHPVRESILFWGTKVYYVIAAFILPHYVGGFGWGGIVLGFITMHVIASLLVTHVLQVEHLVEETDLVSPDEKGVVKKSWAVNQAEGTCNFKAKTALMEWYVGGSNYQIEHHLLPHICAVHYPAISKIVEQTAGEFGVKYNVQPTLVSAIVSHYRLLKKLGRPQPALSTIA